MQLFIQKKKCKIINYQIPHTQLNINIITTIDKSYGQRQ